MGIYENKNDKIEITSIKQQVVKVIEQDGDWLKINTWIGSKWINLKYMPSASELENFMKQYQNTVSVYYENLESGYVYRYNADKLYFSASVIKAPYCLYIYDLAENGHTDLSVRHAYTGKNYIGGSGTIKNMKRGTVFTTNELLARSIRESDNIATKMLMDIYGVSGFKVFVSKIGGDPKKINNLLFNNPVAMITAEEAGLYTKTIYNYIEGGYTHSQQFKNDLMNTTMSMIISDFPIAHKYGWSKKSFHDTAIVYSDSPYVLIIMSARENGNAEDFKVFRDISMKFQGFNEAYFFK